MPPHPHQSLVYSRKQVGATKRIEWGDPSRLERIHRTLRQRYVVGSSPPCFNKSFQQLDKDYPNTLSIRGFNSLLVNSGVLLSQEDVEHLFAFYDAEGHGSMDANDFLIGIRYNLAMDKYELERITNKVENTLVRGKSPQQLETLLRHGGLSGDTITESAFVKALKGFLGTSCTTSELLFLFSVLSKNDRNAVLPSDAVMGMLCGALCERRRPVVDVHDVQERLARIIYDPNSSVSGRVGLNRILARGDKDFNGAVNRREFDCIKSFTPFTDEEVDALFGFYDCNGSGVIYFDDLVQKYRPQDYMQVTEKDMEVIDEIAVRHIRNRSPGGPGMLRTYNRYLEQKLERHDPGRTGYFTLTQFYRAMEDLAGGDLKDMEIEILFEHWAKDGKVDWHEFLKVLLGEAAREAQRERDRQIKLQDPINVHDLQERVAIALYDRDRQTGGPRGFLRIERLFNRHDSSGHGYVTLEEFRRAMRGVPTMNQFDDDDLIVLFSSFDPTASGAVAYMDFIDAMQRILAARARAKQQAEEIPYPYEELSVLQEAVARGAVRRRLGVQGLLGAFGKHDHDGDGYIDRRAFGEVMRYVCDPCPTEENITFLFEASDPQRRGQVAYAPFVESLGIERYYAATEAETKDAFARLAAVFHACTQSGKATPDGLQRLFDRYDRTTKGYLTLSEFLKAMRSLGYTGPALDVEYAYRHFHPHPGLTFAQFNSILRGTALQKQPETAQELLVRLHNEVYGDDNYGTISVARLLNKHDTCKAGVVDFKGFKAALKGAGSSMTEKEMAVLFQAFHPGQHHGAISVREFVEKLRLAVIEPSDYEQIRRLLNILGTSVEFRNQGMGGWITRFERYDKDRTGLVDFVGYTKAVDFVDCNKLSDYEKERLFNHYSADAMTLDYRRFAHDVIYGPLNRGHDHHFDSFGRDPSKHTLESSLLEESILQPPVELLSDQGVLGRFMDVLYSPEKDGMGSLRLSTYFKTTSKGGKYLKRPDFITAMKGLVTPASPVPEYEIVALYEQLREGDQGVNMDALLDTIRYGYQVRLSDLHYSQLMTRIHEHLWNYGKRDLESVRPIFKWDVGEDGFLGLHGFTVCMRRMGGGLYSDLELELLFNEFSPDRRAIEVEKFARAIVPPTRPVTPPVPGPSPDDIQHIIDKLGAHVYDPKQQPGGILEFLKAIRRADRNRDDKLNRQEFAEAIQSIGGMLVCSHPEINALFDAICQGHGTFAQVSVPELLALVQGSKAHRRVSFTDFQDLLYLIKEFLPLVPRDPAVRRAFEHHDLPRSHLISLGPFTTVLYHVMNKDATITELQIEQIFNFLDKNKTGSINYIEFIDALASLPSRHRPKGVSQTRVQDIYRRHDVQPAMVQSPVALRPPPPAELPPATSPFRSTTHMLSLEQPGMNHWHVVAEGAATQPAGGAPSHEAREAEHIRYRGLWVPGTKALTDWGESGSPQVNRNPEAIKFMHYIPACVDNVSEVSMGSALPPYLTEATSLEEWMTVLGLGKYVPLLEANEVDLASVTELREADLQDMGLPIGPRRKILKAAKMMA